MTNANVDATPLTTKPSQDGFYMPAEWAAQQAVWMIWPYRPCLLYTSPSPRD